MNLRLIDGSSVELVAGWLTQKENYQWLDFGNGNQLLHPAAVKIMMQRDTNLIRVFTSEPDENPIGIVALSNIAPNFKTAMLWYVLGDKDYAGQGYTTRAAYQILRLGFTEVGLEAVNAWTVEINIPSIRILERNNFQLIGRQRRCHYIDGRAFDRLLFDLLATEHKGELACRVATASGNN